MTVWAALLRGVNVGGHHRLPMAELRPVLAGLGYEHVATYIQSGNAVFRSEDQADKIASAISEAIAARFGFRPQVIVLSAGALAAALARNPFAAEAEADGTKVHLLFSDNPLTPATVAGLNAAADPGEGARLVDGVLYLQTPGGYGRSPLAQAAARLKAPITGRNARSVAAIAALARAVPPCGAP
ncbi:MAG: DUF1697 domain-containing protein [Paracoccaceae bacterium]|nr:DUF1697 domain-containing protein [Paracoccaceae bacterium]